MVKRCKQRSVYHAVLGNLRHSRQRTGGSLVRAEIMTGLKDLLRIERARHFLVALVIAATLGVTGFLNPLDWLTWATHARLFERQASGDIVFIGAIDDLSDAAVPQHRRDLAMLVDQLGAAGTEKIFLDVRLDQQSSPDADQALKRSIEANDRVYWVDRLRTTVAGLRMQSTIPSLAEPTPHVVAMQPIDLFGWTWWANRGWEHDGTLRQSFAGALADYPAELAADFRIDYSIDHRSIPSISMPQALSALAAGEKAELFEGKFVVIGNGGDRDTAYAAIPRDRKVPVSMVDILAGETLRAGPVADVGWVITFLFFATLLALVLLCTRDAANRHRGYVLVALSIPVWFVLSAQLRMTAHLSLPVTFLLIYGIGRAWNFRSRNASLTDELSGLPSFRALEKDLGRQDPITPISVVVARIHRFDEVLSILPAESHGEYVRLVAERFRIAEKDLKVYSNAGRYLAWIQCADDQAYLEAHLQGLRAVFANPLDVNGTLVDVGITFGADANREASPAQKITSATAVVDRTTESHAPVMLAQPSSTSDRLWSISLQAKIDAALKSGQIYVVYQPQFEVCSGKISGFEALVRWNDTERGPIAPSYFIEQCEHAGRMEALTRKVFEEATQTMDCSCFAEGSYSLSINVSATMLGDERLVDILQQTLAGSRLEPKRITIEVTETSRIGDFDRARAVLGKLRALGVRTSIDDFGVGAANLETLLRLPFDELKIDRNFVSRIREDSKARKIVQSLINLSRDIGLTVVAEGVENDDTLAILKSIGCENVQGYALARPGSISEMENLLRPKELRTSVASH